MTNFLGIKQVLFSEYSGLTQADKIGYLWLVTNVDGNGAKIEGSYDIYFGSRKYSENGVVYHNLINTFGELMDANGAFILPITKNFTSFDEANVDSISDILYALDVVVKKNADDLAKVYTKDQVDGFISGLNTAIASCVKEVNVKVGKQTFEGEFAEGTVTVDITDAFDAAGKVKDVTVDGTSVMNGTTAVIDLSGKADVSSVNAISGRVDALELFKHATDVKYDTNSKKINLYAGEKVLGEGFDAAPFLVDGMLKTVEFVKDAEGKNTTTLRFTFNADGEDKVIDVNFADYVDTYHADEATLTLDSTTNTFSFKSADAEKINVEEIPVGGTPLANILLENDITSITANNLQEVLNSLFSQNLWAEKPRRVVPTALSVSMGDPSITFTPTATTVEVGTEISVSASAANASASASITYSGFTYGYSVDKDNSKDGDTPASVSVTGTKDTDSNYKLTFTTNNGFGSKKLADADAQNISSVEGYDNKLIVAEGTNKVTVSASSPTFSATVPAQDAIYACSSLKKTDDDHVVAASEASDIAGAVVTKTKYDSVTGAYYAFIGFADAIPSNDGFRAAIGNGFTRLGKGAVAAGTCNKTYMYVCVPSGWDFTCNTSLGSDMRGSFTDTGDATITLPNGDTKAYKYYALTYKDGAFKDLVIK